MTDREPFLTRWSRRKREAAVGAPDTIVEPPVVERPSPDDAANRAVTPGVIAPTQPNTELDLPPIDAIDAGTDIAGYLKEGVPQDLARAALRRAWSSDPAIRDFVGLSENAWDFDKPGGVPGFGPFAPDAARQLVAQVFGGGSPVSGGEPATSAGSQDRASSPGDRAYAVVNEDPSGRTEAQPGGGARPAAVPESGQEDTAAQQQGAELARGPADPRAPARN